MTGRQQARAAHRPGPLPVYLTFDDGPDPIWTPRILAELERTGAKATFFVIGERVVEHPDIVLAARAAGHAVELHCMRHFAHGDAWRAEVEADTREAMGVLARLGITPRRWRPPYGQVTPWTAEIASAERLELTGWSVDSGDWMDFSADELLARVTPKLEGGRVVLMHDGVGPGARRDGCAPTARLIEPLVAELRLAGLVPAVLGSEGPVDAALIEHEPPAARGRLSGAEPAVHPTGDTNLAVVAEDRLDAGGFAALGALLARGFPRHEAEYRERSWRNVRPEFRVVARRDRRLIGQISAFRIATVPERQLFGIGDAVVIESARGCGVARQTVELAVAECRRRGAEVVLTDTLLLRSSFRAVGFEAVPRFAFYYHRDSTCCWHRYWMAWLRDGTPPPRLRLEEGDF